MKNSKQIHKKIYRLKEQQEALKSALLAESILDVLVSIVFSPYLDYQASKLKNSPEWKATMRKIKELQLQSDKLEKKAIAIGTDAKSNIKYAVNKGGEVGFKPDPDHWKKYIKTKAL
jgi:hypothetical protein